MIHKSATKKRTRKYQNIKEEIFTKKSKIENIRKLIKTNKKDLAKECIDDYLEVYDEDCYILHELGKFNSTIGNRKQAKALFTYIIDNNYKNKYYSMYELAKIEKFDNNYDKSINLLNQIIESDHEEKCHAKLELSKIYYILDEFELYLNLLDDLIITNQPNKLLAYDYIMDYCIEFKDRNLAIKYFQIGKDSFDEEQKNFYKAVIEGIEGHINKSKENLEKIAYSNSEYKYKAIYQLAIFCFELEDYKKAIEYCNILFYKCPGFETKSCKLLANIYTILNKPEETKFYINKLENSNENQENSINFLYGNMYFAQEEYDQALNYYETVNNQNKSTYRDSLYKMVCVYIKQEKYLEAYEMLKKLEENDFNKKYQSTSRICKAYLENKLNFEITENLLNYAELQAINYDKEAALYHIELHKDENDSKLIHTIFNENVNIKELYNYALLNISKENYYTNNFMDMYILDYPNVGYNDGHPINYVKVITLPNTKQIITIYPYDRVVFDSKNKKVKQKQMSRIDKFNKKYGF